LIQSLTQGAFWSNIQAWRQRHPNMSEHDVALQVISHSSGSLVTEQVREAFVQRQDLVTSTDRSPHGHVASSPGI
jgi:hypothetical protein